MLCNLGERGGLLLRFQDVFPGPSQLLLLWVRRNLVDDTPISERISVGGDRRVGVDDPEQRRGWRFGPHSALDSDVSVAEVRAHRTARYLGRVWRRVWTQTHTTTVRNVIELEKVLWSLQVALYYCCLRVFLYSVRDVRCVMRNK